ncbi:hypothetical protein AX15_002435 [Amanita polypyramis BW_CC]|nr:hypothetical protein AX15_002435 [Amanita polypyramis BW_CC]
MRFTFAFSFLIFMPLSLAKGHYGDTDAPNIAWYQPVPGDAYSPGDTINAQWKSDREIISPSFRLCQSSGNARRRAYSEASDYTPVLARRGDVCGTPIWPVVQQTDGGSYRVSIEVPEISLAQSYYLQMEDNFGTLMQSPIFSVSPAQGLSNDTTASNAPASASTARTSEHKNDASEATLDQSSSTSNATDVSSSIDPQLVNPQSGQAPLSQQNATSTIDGSLPMNSTTRAVPSTSKSPIYSTNLLSSSRPTLVAAFAIPLSAAAAALLIAGGLAVRHRRALRADREKDRQMLRLLEKLRGSGTLPSSASVPLSNGPGDVKHPPTAPQLPHPIQLQSIPLFMPMPLSVSMEQASQTPLPGYPTIGEPRQITRKAFANESSVGHSAPSRPYSRSVYSYLRQSHVSAVSTPIPSTRSRTRNLSTTQTYLSSSPTINETGVGIMRETTSFPAPYLPPLSFSGSPSRRSYPMSKEALSISNSCSTSGDYYIPVPPMNSASPTRLDSVKHSPSHASTVKPPSLPSCLISAPQRLHVRNEAPSGALDWPNVGDEGDHRVGPFSQEHMSTEYGGQGDVYAAVASLLNKSCP